MKYSYIYRYFHLKKICAVLIFSVWLAGCNQSSMPVPNASPDLTASESVPKQASDRSPEPVAADEIQEPDGPLTLRDALSLALLHNPELKAFSYSIRAAEARHLQAGLWPNPELDISVEDVGGSGDLSGFDGAETTIQLSQLLDLAGKDEKLQRVAYFDTKLAESDYHMKRLDIAVAVTTSFIELLFLQEKQLLSQNLINVSEAVIKSVNHRVDAGKDSPLDLLKAKVALEKAKLYHHEIDKQVEALRIRQASYWSSKRPAFTYAEGDLDKIDAVPEISEIQTLLQKNPEIVQWAFEIEKREAELRLARAKSVPDLTVSGGIKHFNADDEAAFVFGLSLPLPVTNRNQGERLEAIHNLNKAKHQEQALYQYVWSRLHQLHGQLQTASLKATVLKKEILSISEKIFTASKVSYEQGKIGYLELLDAQRSYFAAEDEYIDALAQYHIVKTELERLIGQSLEPNETSK